MTERIKLTNDSVVYDWSDETGEEIPNNLIILVSPSQRDILKQQILDDNKKGKLFDFLLIENQTILDTISQVKIGHGMCERENKQLKEKLEKIEEDFYKRLKDYNGEM